MLLWPKVGVISCGDDGRVVVADYEFWKIKDYFSDEYLKVVELVLRSVEPTLSFRGQIQALGHDTRARACLQVPRSRPCRTRTRTLFGTHVGSACFALVAHDGLMRGCGSDCSVVSDVKAKADQADDAAAAHAVAQQRLTRFEKSGASMTQLVPTRKARKASTISDKGAPESFDKLKEVRLARYGRGSLMGVGSCQNGCGRLLL